MIVRPCQIVLTAVTDAYGKGPDHAERMKSYTRVIQVMLRTWSGLMYFCMEEMGAVRSLVDTLRLPSLETRVRCVISNFDLTHTLHRRSF